MSKLIAVSGKGRDCPSEVYDAAYQVGKMLAEIEGVRVLTGGLSGVMDAAAKGAYDAGAVVIGLLPGGLERYEGRVSKYLTLAINTGLPVQLRNFVLASACDAMVALPGSHGTWQEIVTARDLDKPVWTIGRHALVVPGAVALRKMDELPGRIREWMGATEQVPG